MIRTKIKGYLPLLTMFALVSVSCRKTPTIDLHAEATQLFERSTVMIINYTDSLGAAADSARINRLVKNFDSRYTALNFEFPADTDLSMTEEYNDSLIKLLARMVEVRKERLKTLSLAHSDTIQAEEVTLSAPPSHSQHN